MLYLVVVGKDQQSIEKFFADSPAVRTETPGQVVAIANGSPGRGLGKLGNAHLPRARLLGHSVFGLCHADCTFGPGALAVFVETARNRALAGIVGRDLQGQYRWCNGAAAGPGPVSTIDGSCLFIPTSLSLRFDDSRFDSHHCVVEDYCLQAEEIGVPRIIPAAAASHCGESTQRPEWQREYWHYRGVLNEKYSGRLYATT